MIRELFDQIAPKYDLGNALLSFGLHQRWNRVLMEEIARHLDDAGSYLDLCAGTGAIALPFLERYSRKNPTTLLDFSPEMLTIAKQRAAPLAAPIEFIEADAQLIPLADESMSVVSCAYGIRNILDPLRCAREVNRVLKPGGIWTILELTRPRSAVLRIGHRAYLKTALPLVGGILSGNFSAYRYLASSVEQFTPPEELAAQLSTVDFTPLKLRRLGGGIATLLTLKKV